MLKQNLLLFFRNIKKYKTTFLINIIGLSSGLTCVLLISLWIIDEMSFDKFHEMDDRLYQVMELQNNTDDLQVQEITPGPLAEALASEIPGVKYAATLSFPATYSLINEESKLPAQGVFAGSDFFNMFSFPLINGAKNQVLDNLNSIVISKRLAIRLFNTTEDIIGKTLTVQGDKNGVFRISGIFENIPINSSLEFDFVIPFKKHKEWYPWVLNWKNNGVLSFVLLDEGKSSSNFDLQIIDFIKDKGGEKHVSLFSKKFSEKYLYSTYENGKLTGGRIENIYLFSIIAIFILLIACINFINLSTANAFRRLSEIGVKKALGVKRKLFIFQYLSESLWISFISLLAAVLLLYLFLPHFNEISGKQIVLNFKNSQIVIFLSITVITGLLAGIYPALYLSNLSVINILNGKLKNSFKGFSLREGLVVFQFVITIIFIVSVFVVFQQTKFIQNQSLGLNNDQIIQFEKIGNVENNTEYFISQVSELPGVIGVSSINNSLAEGGYGSSSTSLEWQGKNPEDVLEVESVMVDYNMLDMLEIKINRGRSFSKQYNDYNEKIIFNEAAIKAMGLNDPIGKRIRLRGEEKEIIGVTQDFHFKSFRESVKPLLFLLKPERSWLMMVKIEAGNESKTIEALEGFYSSFNPGYSFDYKFIDQDVQAQYLSEKHLVTLSKYFTGMAIIISCLGLFGFAVFTAETRKKEIGIRKVLGQKSIQISVLLSGEFAKIVGIALLIGLPMAFLIMRNWLSKYAYKIDLHLGYFLAAGALTLFVALATVATQVIRAANKNPIDALREE